MADIDIAEAARRTGLAASALRYYEERGLIASSGRRGLRRTFDPAVVEQIALIRLGQAAGFTLEEIAVMFGPAGQPRIDRRQLIEKADALTPAIRRLTAMQEGLRHAARCTAPSHLECPTFRRILKAAGAGKLRPARSPLNPD